MPTLAETMPKFAGEQSKLVSLLLDSSKPPELRAKILYDVVRTNPDQGMQLLLFTEFFQSLAACGSPTEAVAMKERYEQALSELENGALRPANYLGVAEIDLPGQKERVHVVTPDGHERFPLPHPRLDLSEVARGTTVYLDAKGSVVLAAGRTLPTAGQEVIFRRRLENSDEVEIEWREDKLVWYAAQQVLDAIHDGEVKNGNRLLACPQQQLVFGVVPDVVDRRHRFVDESRVPEVIAGRDIGKPHWVLGYMVRRLRLMLFRPDLLERFDLRPRLTVLLTGPTGCGKTLTIRAFLHEFQRLIRERTGRDDIGSRVIRVKVAELLSEWLGRSDKNIEELFDDIHSIASEEVETADGKRTRLPAVVIFEEVEGMGRRRGEHDGGIMDRIIGTLLARLDDPTEDLAKLPMILITTSNRPDLLDSAMWRRLAGVRATYKRLDREGFAAVLGKKLKPQYPFASLNGHTPDQLRSRAIDQVVGWLFSPNGQDPGLVELTFADGKKVVKHRRDFLTGAIVEQAVANAIDQTVFAADEPGTVPAGLSSTRLIEALRQHIDDLADNLTAHNAADYVDVPENARVAALRRLRGSGTPLTTLISDNVS